MKIVNAVGSRLPGVVIGLAQQKAAALARAVKIRPYRKTLAYTTDATQDIYLIIIQLGISPGGDRVVIVNGNEFRIISATNETLGDGSVFPIVTWKGGIPPFVVKLVWFNPYGGGFYDEDVTDKVVNINTNLTDGDGDIVTGGVREYIITKVDDADGWWTDDLGMDDLGINTDTSSPEYQQRRQNNIGLLVADSSVPPRKLFFPFSPDPEFETDGISPAGLFAKYPGGHFGPPVWCLPVVHWDQPAAIVYGTPLQTGSQLTAYTHIPDTSTPLPGTYNYWLDAEHTNSAENTVPNASSNLPIYVTFQADDDLHYHLAKASQDIVVNKAGQAITNLYAAHNTKSVIYWGSELSHVQVRPGETATISAYIASGFNSGNLIQFASSSAACSAGASSKVTDTNHKATLTFNQAGAFYVTASLQGNDNFEAASPVNSMTFKVGFGVNVPGGVSFDINDNPITYGEALDVLCWSPISGDPAYQTAGEPAGWIVDPVPGTHLETNSDGTPHAYSITALFYPLDTVNYPSPMEYEQWLTVGKDTPVPVWSTAASFVYGMKWLDIMNALFYNSHHVGVFGWAVEGNSLYEVSGHSKSQWNGVITDSGVMPDVDSGIFVSCQFTPTGTEVHNYETPQPTDPLDHGFDITKKALTITASNASKTYNGSAWSGGNGVTYNGFVQRQDQIVLAGTLWFSGAAQGAINAGTYVNGIAPGGLTSDNYAITFVPGSLTVYKATPDIVFSLPESIVEGQTLSAYKATSSISGLTFTYHKDSPTGSLVDMAAAQSFNTGLAIYAVSDSTQNYNSASTWDGVVIKGQVAVSATISSNLTYGSALSITNQSATHNGVQIAGTWSYTLTNASNGQVTSISPGSVINAGSYIVTAIFTPNDSVHYLGNSDFQVLIVSKATPVTMWPTAISATYIPSGQTVSSARMTESVYDPNTAADITSLFADYYYVTVNGVEYNMSGSWLDVGTYSARAVFVSNSSNYESVTETATITVSAAAMSFTVLGNNQIRVTGGRAPYSNGYYLAFDSGIDNTIASRDNWDGTGFVLTISQSPSTSYWCAAAGTGITLYDDTGHSVDVNFQNGFSPPAPSWVFTYGSAGYSITGALYGTDVMDYTINGGEWRCYYVKAQQVNGSCYSTLGGVDIDPGDGWCCYRIDYGRCM